MSAFELLDRSRSILVVIDEQVRLMDLIHRPRLVIDATLRLMRLAELFGVPTLLTEQYPQGLGETQAEVRAAFDALTSPKRYLDKTSFGCAGDAGFLRALDEMMPAAAPEHRQIVIAGIETHVCVMQTALELLRQGSGVYICWDAVSGRGAEYREMGLRRLEQAGAVLTNNESVGFEWCRDKNDPAFKAMNAIFREGQLGAG